MSKWTSEGIAERIKAGKFTQLAQDQLERTRSHIEPQLIRLLHHRDAFVREIAATILGNRRRAESVPALLRAVSDPSEYVAFDAIIAIEKCVGLETGELVSSLFLNLNNPRGAAPSLRAWWRIVKKHVLA